MGRNTSTNRIYEDPNSFPSGMKALGGGLSAEVGLTTMHGSSALPRLHPHPERARLWAYPQVWPLHLSRHLPMQVRAANSCCR